MKIFFAANRVVGALNRPESIEKEEQFQRKIFLFISQIAINGNLSVQSLPLLSVCKNGSGIRSC